jgi:hypothetical protein
MFEFNKILFYNDRALLRVLSSNKTLKLWKVKWE